MGKSEIRWDKSITGDLPNSDELQTEIATDLILFCKRLRLCISPCETIKGRVSGQFRDKSGRTISGRRSRYTGETVCGY